MNIESTDGKLNAARLNRELEFTASRSEGPGGQNVNKVNSKITLRWDTANSLIISEDEKRIIKERLSSFLTKDGILMLSAQDKRSQLQNKEAVMEKLDALLAKAFGAEAPFLKYGSFPFGVSIFAVARKQAAPVV